jgi:hypothetical protein
MVQTHKQQHGNGQADSEEHGPCLHLLAAALMSRAKHTGPFGVPFAWTKPPQGTTASRYYWLAPFAVARVGTDAP